MMRLESRPLDLRYFPMRVRCVDARGIDSDLTEGVEYIADFAHGAYYWIQGSGNYWSRRFKPIVRVKAPTRRYWPGMTLKRPVATFLFDAMIEASLC